LVSARANISQRSLGRSICEQFGVFIGLLSVSKLGFVTQSAVLARLILQGKEFDNSLKSNKVERVRKCGFNFMPSVKG
jgi:hypothetical protein